MATASAQARRASGQARSALRERLEARREEIEAAALTRVRAIADPAEVPDPAYAEGLGAAVSAAVAYGIETTGREASDPPIPVALLGQARMAARVGIPLDTVLRRYFAGYSLLGYFILEEATNAGLSDGAELKRLLGTHAGIFDRLLAAIGAEHARESEALRSSSHSMQAERIERLLSGEPLDTSEISYDFEGWHLGAVATGPGAAHYLRDLARELDARPLIVERQGSGAVWVWLGRRDGPDRTQELALPSVSGCQDVRLALGEPGIGLAGWQLTHRQAAAALPIAKRGPEPIVLYAEVALLVAIIQDDLLSTSLRRLYLEPLRSDRDGGKTSLQALRAYFTAECQVSSAAAALDVNRNTVTNRLRTVEALLDRPFSSCALELQAVLRLEEFERRSNRRSPTS